MQRRGSLRSEHDDSIIASHHRTIDGLTATRLDKLDHPRRPLHLSALIRFKTFTQTLILQRDS